MLCFVSLWYWIRKLGEVKGWAPVGDCRWRQLRNWMRLRSVPLCIINVLSCAKVGWDTPLPSAPNAFQVVLSFTAFTGWLLWMQGHSSHLYSIWELSAAYMELPFSQQHVLDFVNNQGCCLWCHCPITTVDWQVSLSLKHEWRSYWWRYMIPQLLVTLGSFGVFWNAVRTRVYSIWSYIFRFIYDRHVVKRGSVLALFCFLRVLSSLVWQVPACLLGKKKPQWVRSFRCASFGISLLSQKQWCLSVYITSQIEGFVLASSGHPICGSHQKRLLQILTYAVQLRWKR